MAFRGTREIVPETPKDTFWDHSGKFLRGWRGLGMGKRGWGVGGGGGGTVCHAGSH